MLPSYSQLKEKFKTLLQQDNIDNETDDLYIQKDRNKRAKFLVENESLEQEMEQFCQGGIPTSYRVDIYMKYFGVEGNQGNNKFQQLLDEYDKNNSIFDIILISDGHEASFDDKYFVFQNNFEKILKVFIRDKEVYKNARIHPQNFDKLSNADQSKVPQCGFFFPKLFTKYIQPFGYTSMKLDVIYTLFKQFYCRYFCYLLSLSSIKDSLLYLVMLFEDLFQSTDQRLLNHLSQIENFDVIQVGINWIQYCFIGYMAVEEIFLIFDRIIGYKGLDILAVLAVAIFRHKSDSLFKCTSMKEVDEVLNRPVEDSFLNLIQNYFVY
ncbi:Rab-GTPase-TBC domain [Pseudocohnilembus persalinus]|uniref:Rab-GTPase-TBC domain n=1 Tax=Pseudocohnilembus persalinus TaxID=266149 RepID=A0A0V0QAI2_PSEPJ|nr:Rab-GTPase-TBC domain [Pseudocohnilembus persalinus]|eukprot:KRW99221.1 Rab-GTPase-TBC domain [Pseudocohnilembus persalinus]